MAQKDHRKEERTKTPGIYKRGNTYVVRWKFRGKSQKRHFRTQAEAREFKRGLSGSSSQPTSRATVAGYFDTWIDSYRGRTARGLETTSREEYRRSFRLHVIPYPLARVKIRDVTSTDIDKWFTALEADGVRPPSIRKAKAAMSAMLATANQARDIQTNPVVGVRYVPQVTTEKRKQRKLTVEDANAIIAAVEPQWRPFFQLLAESGLRVGEALGLRWANVHLGDDARIYVVEQVYQGQRKKLKTEGSERTVPLSAGMARTLTDLKSETAFSADDDPAFPSKVGTPLSYANCYNRVLAPALRSCGLEGQGIGFHAFRKLAGSVLSGRAGKTLVQVQKWLGHAQLATTLAAYQHELDDGLGGAGELDGIWGHPGDTDVPQTATTDGSAPIPETVD